MKMCVYVEGWLPSVGKRVLHRVQSSHQEDGIGVKSKIPTTTGCHFIHVCVYLLCEPKLCI